LEGTQLVFNLKSFAEHNGIAQIMTDHALDYPNSTKEIEIAKAELKLWAATPLYLSPECLKSNNTLTR
jgi:hypothetical protein